MPLKVHLLILTHHLGDRSCPGENLDLDGNSFLKVTQHIHKGQSRNRESSHLPSEPTLGSRRAWRYMSQGHYTLLLRNCNDSWKELMETPRAFHVYSAYLEVGSSQDIHAVCTDAWKRGHHLLGPQGGCLPTAQLTAKSGWSVYMTQEGCFKLECTQHPEGTC